MQVSTDHWVTVHYRLFDSEGEPVEDGVRELTYLHGGYGNVFTPIEVALEGKGEGESVSLYLEPADTFGDYDADLVAMVERERLPERVEAGMTFEGIPGEASDGRLYTVTDMTDHVVVLDGNHPLAGMALRFELTVVGVRPADFDEIEQERERAARDDD